MWNFDNGRKKIDLVRAPFPKQPMIRITKLIKKICLDRKYFKKLPKSLKNR